MSSSRAPSLRKRKQVNDIDDGLNDDDNNSNEAALPTVPTMKSNKKSKASIESSSKVASENEKIAHILISKAGRLDLEELIKSQLTTASIIELLSKGSNVNLARNVVTGKKFETQSIELAHSDLGYFSPFDSDILVDILTNLSTQERIMMVTTVSKGFNNLCSNAHIWNSTMALGDNFGGYDRGMKVDAGGLKILADKIVSKKIDVSELRTLQLCSVKSKTSTPVTNYKSFLKVTGPFFKNVRVLRLFGKLSGNEHFLQHLPFSSIQEIVLLRDEVSDNTLFQIFKNAPGLTSFTGTHKSITEGTILSISNGAKSARTGGCSILEKFHVSPLYDFYTPSLSIEYFFFDCPALFPELTDVNISIAFASDVRTPSHATSIEANPNLWRNYCRFDPLQNKTSAITKAGTRIDYNRNRFVENGTRLDSTYVEKSIKNAVFSRLTHLKIKIAWETTQILNCPLVETIHAVLDERSDFIFNTIGTSCPQLESLDIRCNEFKTPYMNSKEKKSNPRPFVCPNPRCLGIDAIPATMKNLKLSNFQALIEDFVLLRTSNFTSITFVNCGDDNDTTALKTFLSDKCNEKCKIVVEKKLSNPYYF